MKGRTTGFGCVPRQFRERAGRSQELLAERAGLSLRGVSDLERGARITPRLETVRMLADGLELDSTDRAALLCARNATGDPPPPASPGVTHLPAPSSTFVGRRAEMSTIPGMLMSPDIRLVTLTGPGRVGKTQLALEVAGGPRSVQSQRGLRRPGVGLGPGVGSAGDRRVVRIDEAPEEHARRVDALIRALEEPGWRKHWGGEYAHDTESVLEVALGWRPGLGAGVPQAPATVVQRRDAR